MIQPLDQSKNIRCIIGLDDTDLKASMEKSGWLPQFPAYADENGVLIVGHRRMKIARELGLAPVTQTIEFGTGTDGDARRLELAIASNIGAANLSKEDRRRIAVLAYQHNYRMEQIGKMLGVSHQTVMRDLKKSTFVHVGQTPGIDSLGRKNTGRPRKSTAASPPASGPVPPGGNGATPGPSPQPQAAVPKPPSTNEKSPNAALNKENLAQDFHIGLLDGIRVKLELSEKEFKLLNRALNPQSAPNEIDKALVAFGRSYRTRHSSIQR